MSRLEEALRAFDTCLALHPRSSKVHDNRGTALHKLGRYEEALAEHDKALELDPESTNAYSNKSATLFELGRHEEALVAADKALTLDPDHAGAHTGRECLQEQRAWRVHIGQFGLSVELIRQIDQTVRQRG